MLLRVWAAQACTSDCSCSCVLAFATPPGCRGRPPLHRPRLPLLPCLFGTQAYKHVCALVRHEMKQFKPK